MLLIYDHFRNSTIVINSIGTETMIRYLLNKVSSHYRVATFDILVSQKDLVNCR